MSNDIGSFHPSNFNPYQRVGRNTQVPAQPSTGAEDAQKADEAHTPTNSDASTEAQSLSAAEREMIERKFPSNPDLSMRLYGPNRDTQTVNPSVLGNNLDMRG